MYPSSKFSKVLAGLALAVMTGCSPAPQPTTPAQKPPSQASQQWSATANGFIEDYLRAQPAFAAQAGRHEFDGQLPDMSSHGIKREIARLHDARTKIAAVDPAPLEPRERFDREYLLSVVDRDLFWLEKARAPFTNPYAYINNVDPDMYLNRNYAPLDVRLKAYIKYAHAIPKMVADIQANLTGPLPKTFVELAIDDFGGFANFYSKDVPAIFASVADPELQKQLTDADTNAATAMNNLKYTSSVCVRPPTTNSLWAKSCLPTWSRTPSGSTCRWNKSRLSAGGSRTQYSGAQDGMRDLFAEGNGDCLYREGGSQQNPRGELWMRRARSWRH